MRDYPHKPDQNLLAESLKYNREDYDSFRSKSDHASAEPNARFFKRLGDIAMDLAGLEYAFEGSRADVTKWLAAACEAAGQATQFALPLDPNLYMTYLSLAVLCSTDELGKGLEGFQRSRFTNENVKADDVFYLAAEAMRDIAAGRLQEARKASEAGLARLKTSGPNPAAKQAMEAILLLEQAIAEKDQAKLVAAVRARSEKDRASYSKTAARNFPIGLLDTVGLALLKLARENGLQTPDDSVYLPIQLLEP